MNGILTYLWLIPALPLLAAGILSLTRQPHRRLAATLAIGAMGISFVLSIAAFLATLHPGVAKGTDSCVVWGVGVGFFMGVIGPIERRYETSPSPVFSIPSSRATRLVPESWL